MNLYINGEQLDNRAIEIIKRQDPEYIDVYTTDWKPNVYGALHAWANNTGYGLGDEGPGFLNVTTSGTTGHPQRIAHSRETIEQVVDSNIKLLNLHKDSRIVSLYSPRGIAFTVLSLYIAEKLNCNLYIESFNGLNYIDRINTLRPSHTLILPNIWKTLHNHPRWQEINYSSCDTLITGSDFTPEGMLDELRQHGPRKVYNVYGSTEVPPIVLYSEEENTYTADSVPDGCEVRIDNSQIACKWSSQTEWWTSGDCVEGDINRFTLNGRVPNMFKQNNIRVYPEQVEKAAVAAGAELALCQQVNNQCVLHYTGKISNIDEFQDKFNYIPRFRLKPVNEIKVDDNLKKIIRTQTF